MADKVPPPVDEGNNQDPSPTVSKGDRTHDTSSDEKGESESTCRSTCTVSEDVKEQKGSDDISSTSTNTLRPPIGDILPNWELFLLVVS